jgi:hypothetical protein
MENTDGFQTLSKALGMGDRLLAARLQSALQTPGFT